MAKKNCGNCDYCERTDGDMVCCNMDSEYGSDFVDKNHSCSEWEGDSEECE